MLSHADTCEYYDKGYFVRNGKSERVSLTRTDIRIALSKKGVSASFIHEKEYRLFMHAISAHEIISKFEPNMCGTTFACGHPKSTMLTWPTSKANEFINLAAMMHEGEDFEKQYPSILKEERLKVVLKFRAIQKSHLHTKINEWANEKNVVDSPVYEKFAKMNKQKRKSLREFEELERKARARIKMVSQHA